MERWIAESFYADWQPSMRADKVLYEAKSEHQHLCLVSGLLAALGKEKG